MDVKKNMIIYGENLEVMKCMMPEYANMVDLIYVDPPYMTGAKFRIGKNRTSTMSVEKNSEIAYTDVMKYEEFISMIKERIKMCSFLLSDKGSFYMHMDSKVAYDIKPYLDEVFGRENFRNSICRIKTSSKNFKQSNYGSIHDTVLFYTKSENFIWNEPMMNVTEKYKEKFNKKDKFGYYNLVPLTAPGQTMNGDTGMPWMGISPPKGRHWAIKREKMDILNKEGKIIWSKNNTPRVKKYLHEAVKKGIRASTLWDFKDPHRPNYPTEKNLEMLELIIKTSSNINSLVMDFFCGSGTTLLAAKRLNRIFIGIDQSKYAIKVARERCVESPD